MSTKSRIESGMDFTIEVFFLTNLWIILYTKTIDLLYFLFPPATPPVAIYPNRLPNPEPFEIPLYLIFSVLFVGIIWFYHVVIRKLFNQPNLNNLVNQKFFIVLKFLIFSFLLLLFLSKLGSFPLSGDLHPYQLQRAQKLHTVIPVLYLVSLGFIILELFLLEKLAKERKIIFFGLSSFVILFIAVFIFTPRFPISPFDSALFYGPIWDISHGKTIFADTPSQYGFLSILFFVLIHKITQINFVYLPILIWVMYIFEYSIIFYLVLKISRSLAFSALSVFSILTMNYTLSTYGPQAGPIRWLPIFFLLLLFYKFKKIDAKILLLLVPLLSFWNIDSGIALLLGYIYTLIFLFITKSISLKRLIRAGIYLFFSSLFLIGIIQITHLLLGFKVVDFLKLYHSIQKNAVLGILMVPIPIHTYFWLVLLIYFASIIYFFRSSEKNGIELSLLLFSANFMLFASIYYVGRSMPHELYTISIFALLTVFLLIGSFYSSTQSAKLRLAILLILFIFFLIFPVMQRRKFFSEKIYSKYSIYAQKPIFSSDIDQILQTKYKMEIDLIKRTIKKDQTIIISADSTYLFYLTKKNNSLNVNPIVGSIDMKTEMDSALKSLNKCPQKIVIDCSIIGKCPDYKTLAQTDTVVLKATLEEIQKKCKVEYEPDLCTNQLCIAELRK